MNLNDFVVLPNNKARSVRLTARNLQGLQSETATLANESKDMEEKLQLLKDSMSKEKEERGHSGSFRWTSGQGGSSNSNSATNSSKKNKENKLQKQLSAGKLKIRVLKDEPLRAPPQPPPPLATVGPQMTRRSRLKGTICGQCEVKTAGLMCAECSENYCVGCFARFHQKGALKLHRMIPIQTGLQTHVSTRDVVGCFQNHIDPGSYPGSSTIPKTSRTAAPCGSTRRADESPETGTEAEEQHLKYDSSQVLVVNRGGEMKMGMAEDDTKGFPSLLLSGEYNEEESARSFQEAVRQWRGEESDGGGELVAEEAMWIPVRPVSVSAIATQADLPPDREAKGQRRGGGQERVPVKVEFTETSLTYMDRLHLKKHRRTPVEPYHPSPALGADLKSPPPTNTEEETASGLTAEEEDFRCYCASLLAVPVSRGRAEPEITAPESCLVIEVLDETSTDVAGVCATEQRTATSREVPSVQRISRKGRTLVPQTALSSGGSSRVSHSSPGPAPPSRPSGAPAQPRTAHKLRSTKASQAERSVQSLSSQSKPSASPTAETSRTSKASIKTPTSKSPRSFRSPTIHESNTSCGSPQRLSSLPLSPSETPEPSPSPLSFSAAALAGNRSPIPEEHLSPSPSTSFSLRSTFTVSPSSSTESTLFPKVYHSAPLHKGSDSFLLEEEPRSSQVLAEPISSPKLCELPRSNLMSPEQSQHSCRDPESLLSHNQLLLPLSPLAASPHRPAEPLQPRISQISPVPRGLPAKALSRLSPFNESLPDVYSRCRSTPTHEHAPVFMSSTPMSGDHKSTLSHPDAHCVPSSRPVNVIQNPPFAVNVEEEEEPSADSADEMSSDSLGLALHEEDSSDEEMQIQGRLTRARSREGQENPATSHLEDSFVPAEAETREDAATDEPEQLSEPCMVMHSQSAGRGSERLCDPDGFSPPGLDMHTGHSAIPRHAHCDPLHTCLPSLHDSHPTGSEIYWSSSSLRTDTEEHLVRGVIKDSRTRPSAIQTHSTRRGGISADEPGTSGRCMCAAMHPGSGSNPSHLSHPPRSNPSPLSAPVSPWSSQSPSPPPPPPPPPPPLSACLFRPTSGSEFGPASRPLSRAAQEIMEICSVDQTGCEDPDLDTDAAAHTLLGLERELRLMAEGAGSARNKRRRRRLQRETGKVSSHYLETRGTAAEEDHTVGVI